MRRRVLIVDDDEGVRNLLTRVVEMKGFAADVASDGVSGVNKALACDYELILMDDHMPGCSGSEAVKRIMARKPRQRIVIVTGTPMDESVRQALRDGALACLAKPFDIEDMTKWLELEEKLKELSKGGV